MRSRTRAGHDAFVARQPIFDRRKKVFGYELLFRSGFENCCPPTDGTAASQQVLHTAWIELGLSALVGPKLPFVNFTRELLLSGIADALPADSLVIEVLEDVEPEPDVLDACRELKQNGYMLALDDFIYRPGMDPLIALADIVKIRMGEADLRKQRDYVRRIAPDGPTLLAEKVETRQDFDRAVALGFGYFQGWFFCRPEIVVTRTLTGSRLTYLKLVQAISRKELRIGEIEKIIRSDVSITHRFMKYLRTASFGFRSPVNDVHHALVLLGEKDIRRWVSLVALRALAEDKPPELIVNAAVRGRFCEVLARETDLLDRQSDLFLVGVFSLLDTMLDQQMSQVLAELPLDAEIKTALEHNENALTPVLDYVESFEQGDWGACDKIAGQLQLDPVQVTRLYRESVEWAMEGLAG